MAKLPKPLWLSLQEALDFTVQETGEQEQAAKEALKAAFRHNEIATRARCESYSRSDMQLPQRGSAWDQAEIDWKANTFSKSVDSYPSRLHVFTDVEIGRCWLEDWLGLAEEDVPAEDVEAPAPETEDFSSAPPKQAKGKPHKTTTARRKKAHEDIEAAIKTLGGPEFCTQTRAALQITGVDTTAADALRRKSRHYLSDIKAAKRQT